MYRIFKKQVAILALLIAPLFLHKQVQKLTLMNGLLAQIWALCLITYIEGSIKLEVQAMVVLI